MIKWVKDQSSWSTCRKSSVRRHDGDADKQMDDEVKKNDWCKAEFMEMLGPYCPFGPVFAQAQAIDILRGISKDDAWAWAKPLNELLTDSRA